MDADANLLTAYRQERRDFIAACEKAGADAISRVHPAKGPDGKPLFCDSAALGPRGAARALLLIAGRGGLVTMLLRQGLAVPQGTRLVLVHALDPFARVFGRPGMPPDWPRRTLASIATEDMAQVRELVALDMDGTGAKAALAAALPKAAILLRKVAAPDAQTLIGAAIAAL